MSNFSHPMVRRSERNPRAEVAGDNDPFNGSNRQPTAEMESQTSSSTESSDPLEENELTEQVAAVSPPPVSRSPGVEVGLSADATPFPPPVMSEMELGDAETNISKVHTKLLQGCQTEKPVALTCGTLKLQQDRYLFYVHPPCPTLYIGSWSSVASLLLLMGFI